MTAPVYRRPREYIPPYNYCDRWCERCVIDKTRCEVYQRETNDRLHHEIDGVDPDDTDVVIADVNKNFDEALLLLREKAKELGVDLDKVEDPPEPPPRRPKTDPLFRRARELTTAISRFLRDHRDELATEFKRPYEVIAWYYLQVGAKLGRISFREAGGTDDYDEACNILTAQVAHQGLSRMLKAIQEIGASRRTWRDELLSTMAGMQKLMKEIEKRWLSRSSALLEPVIGDQWWGPLQTAPILRKKQSKKR